jgi:hypothetical protein
VLSAVISFPPRSALKPKDRQRLSPAAAALARKFDRVHARNPLIAAVAERFLDVALEDQGEGFKGGPHEA